MPTSAELTDTYLAALLEKEANDFAKGIRTSSRPTAAPKPNLRFLRNIIKDTDSHNAVLIEREKRLAASGAKRAYERARDDERSSKRREADDDDRSGKRKRSENSNRWASALGHAGLRRNEDKDRRRHDRARSVDNDDKRARRTRTDRRSRSPREDRRSRRRQSRSRSVSQDEHRNSKRRRSRSPQRQAQPKHDSDSDPLDAIVGPRPAPAVKLRGRGVTGELSGFDIRFKDPGYDPSKDTNDDEWNMALSAMQDRQKWRAIGADRLRAAGFSEAEIRKWEGDAMLRPATEDVDNVVWNKRGEAREWDRGKVIDGDGDVTTNAAWTQAD